MLIDRNVFVERMSIQGRVIDETRNTLLIATGAGVKRVVKNGNVFLTSIDGKETRVKGDQIRLRPWEYAI